MLCFKNENRVKIENTKYVPNLLFKTEDLSESLSSNLAQTQLYHSLTNWTLLFRKFKCVIDELFSS